jgi:two-component system NtrC family sensor kinase
MMDDERKRLMSIFDSMVDGVYVTDSDLNVEYMNGVMINDFGEGLGRKCYQVIQRKDEVCPWCTTKEVFEGKSIRWEHYNERLDRTFDLVEFPLKHSDGTISKVSLFRDITQSKKSEGDYKRLFENVRSGLYVSSKEGKFLNANKALLDMLDYNIKEEFLKMDITHDLYLRPEDRRSFQKMIERDGYVIDYEVDFKRKDGTRIPVQLTSHVRYDQEGKVLGYEGIIVDQSQREQMEEEYRRLFENVGCGVFISSKEGKFLNANQALLDMLGYESKEEFLKINISKDLYLKPEDRREFQEMIERDGQVIDYEVDFKRKDGRTIPVSLTGHVRYDQQGKVLGYEGINVDLSQRLAMESKLVDTQEKLLQSEKLAAMGRLTSQIAHELNNPLYGIMNTLELLKTEVSPQSKRRKILEMALSETERLTELLRKMLSFSKPDEEEKQPTDINTILDEILLLVGKQLQENSIRISSHLADNLAKVHASRNQLRQVFLNMISNAKDAMPEGGTLTVKTMGKGRNIYIDMIDTGTGISEENIPKVFDTFFTTKESVKDVGLGLSVCYGFINEHGGDIRVASKLGSGTTFTISLPIWKEDVLN